MNAKKLFEKHKTANFSTLTDMQRLDLSDELNSTVVLLESKMNTIKNINEKIMEQLDEDDDISDELTASTDFELELQKNISRYKRLQNELQQPRTPFASPVTFQHQPYVPPKNDGVRLPKIEIPKFKGDPLHWTSFKDTFTATIHDNPKLSDIEKFTYLKSYVRDEAEHAIEGLPLSAENYDKAWKLLSERYGNSQLIRSSLMNKLIKLEKATNGSAKELRKMYDTIESNVRALKSTGIEKETLGPMLIPIVLEKLPNVVRLHLSRTLGSDTWDITEFLKAINEEILARENFDFLKQETDSKPPPKAKGSSLNVGSVSRKFCRFCSSKEHYSDQCTIVTSSNARREILRQNRCCFMCLKPGHSKKDCTVSIKCFKCGARGNHPTALCQQTRDGRNSEKTPTERKEENEKNNEEIKTSTVETVVIEKIRI